MEERATACHPTFSAGAHRRPSQCDQRAESVRVVTLLVLLFVSVDARTPTRGATSPFLANISTFLFPQS
jgi:hypothetical protein